MGLLMYGLLTRVMSTYLISPCTDLQCPTILMYVNAFQLQVRSKVAQRQRCNCHFCLGQVSWTTCMRWKLVGRDALTRAYSRQAHIAESASTRACGRSFCKPVIQNCLRVIEGCWPVLAWPGLITSGHHLLPSANVPSLRTHRQPVRLGVPQRSPQPERLKRHVLGSRNPEWALSC